MSDSAQIVMQLDRLAPGVRTRMVDDIVSWLVGEEVITRSPRLSAQRAQFGLSDWTPGRNWKSVVEYDPDVVFESLMHNGVEFTAHVEMQSAFANSEEPTCDRCRAALPMDESFGDLIEAWLSSGEPTVSCHACRWTAPLGDWPTRFPPGLVGAPTITFHNWLPLRDQFVDEMIARLGGGRCRFFWQHL